MCTKYFFSSLYLAGWVARSLNVGEEFDKLLDNENLVGLYQILANPLCMSIIVLVIILIAIWINGTSSYIRLSFYLFVVVIVSFALHDTLLIKEVKKEIVD